MDDPIQTQCGSLRQAIDEAVNVTVLTGAGISAESGVPTFRGKDGLWRNFSAGELATPGAFGRDPRLVWEWYDWRRSIVKQAQPNPGHFALAELQRRKTGGNGKTTAFTLITQNVDGLHDRAGSEQPLKLHGDLWYLRCVECSKIEKNEDVPLRELPPRCACGGLIRPAVVWFGEPLPEIEWDLANKASERGGIFMVVGTAGVVYPAAGLAGVAYGKGAKLAVINPEPTPLDHLAQWVLRGPAGEILPRLV
ncbi:MAG TPA: NAD-dependent deacylase [Terriglobia bacterium]|nr:NAD-dependent deacylase [Terriglobia bacterium]